MQIYWGGGEEGWGLAEKVEGGLETPMHTMNGVISLFMSVVFLANLCSVCSTFVLKICFINIIDHEFCTWSGFGIFKIFSGFVPN